MSGVEGYGFSISTQPWLVHGLNHFVTKVTPGSPADQVRHKRNTFNYRMRGQRRTAFATLLYSVQTYYIITDNVFVILVISLPPSLYLSQSLTLSLSFSPPPSLITPCTHDGHSHACTLMHAPPPPRPPPSPSLPQVGLKAGDKILQLDDVTTSSLSHKIVAARLAAAAEQRRPVAIVIGSEGAVQASTSAFAVGDVVEALSDDGVYYDATVDQINVGDGTVGVLFTENNEHASVTTNNVRMNDSQLPAYWTSAFVAGGEKYYYNTVTNVTSWEFPTDSAEDELAGIATATFDSNDADEAWVATAKFNQACAGYRVRVHPKAEASYIIYGGTCEFGPEVAATGLTGRVFFDPANPKATMPFRPSVRNEMKGAVALVERGEIYVSDKVRRCQEAGAIGCIIVNTDPKATLFNIVNPGNNSEEDIFIPVTNLTHSDGQELIIALQEGVQITIELEDIQRQPKLSFIEQGDILAQSVANITLNHIGRKCRVDGAREGTLAFVGHHTETGDETCGVALDNPETGMHTGTVDGVRYFVCDVGRGMLCPASSVVMLDETPVPVMMQDADGLKVSDIGRRCTVEKYGAGTLQFIGLHGIHQQPRAGVELERMGGKHNGTTEGHYYFKCRNRYGLLCLPQYLTLDAKPDLGVANDPGKGIFKSSGSESAESAESPTRARSVKFPGDEEMKTTHNYIKENAPVEDEPSVDYIGLENYKPAMQGDLAFKSGDLIHVVDDRDGPDGWFYGTHDVSGESGSFPGRTVKKAGAASGAEDLAADGKAPWWKSLANPEDVKIVEVDKKGKGIGIVVLAPTSLKETTVRQGIFVKRVKAGGPAEGKLEAKQRILEVNGKDVSAATKDEYTGAIAAADGKVTLKVTASPDVDGFAKFQSTNPADADVYGPSIGGAALDAVHGPSSGDGGDDQFEEGYEVMNPKTIAGDIPMQDVEGFPTSCVGKRCVVSYGAGTVRFVGFHATKNLPRIGVELDGPTGKHNGTLSKTTYFVCAAKHGVLLGPSKVKLEGAHGAGSAAVAATPVVSANSAVSATPAATNMPLDLTPYEGLGRMQLIKRCKARELDYKTIAKDVQKLKELLAGSDAAGSSVPAPVVAAPGAGQTALPPVGGVPAGTKNFALSGTWTMHDAKRGIHFYYKWSQVPGSTEFTGDQLNASGGVSFAGVRGSITSDNTIEWEIADVVCTAKVNRGSKSLTNGVYRDAESHEKIGEFTGTKNLSKAEKQVEAEAEARAKAKREAEASASLPPAAPAAVTEAPARPAQEYSSLGRLKLIGLCKKAGLDYKAIAKDVDALRKMLVANDADNGATVPTAAVSTPAPAPVPAASAGAADDEVTVSIAKPLGLSFDGNKKDGLFIMNVKPGKAAALTSKVFPKQKIVALDGESIAGLTKKGLLTKLKDGASTTVVLTLADSPAEYAAFEMKKNAKAEKTRAAAATSAPPPSPPATLSTNPFDAAPTDVADSTNPFGATPAVPATPAGPAIDYASMGRLKLLKLAKERGLDFKPVQKDAVGLRRLLQGADASGKSQPNASSGGGGGTPRAAVVAVATAPALSAADAEAQARKEKKERDAKEELVRVMEVARLHKERVAAENAAAAAPTLSSAEQQAANIAESSALALKEGRDMTREESLGLGSASVEDTENRLKEMKFDFSFGN